ncbi:hypothetical protein EDC01DRAFT_730619 [Geopyxis carbonaria]|nr:hypothetical protein EDC01DRAFT_730619 [Geopyxis carbonaria]
MTAEFPSKSSPFDDEQWNALLFLADALIPSLDASEKQELQAFAHESLVDGEWSDIEPFLDESARDCPEFTASIIKLVSGMQTPTQNRILFILNVLSGKKGRLMSKIFTGTTIPFVDLDRNERAEVLMGWGNAYTGFFKALLRSLSVVVAMAYMRSCPLAHRAMSYAGPKNVAAAESSHSKLPEHDFQFEAFDSSSTTGNDLTADVVVIGSGAGGGVAAARLAEAGLNVIVLEKGEYVSRKELPLDEMDAYRRLYEGSPLGILRTPDNNGTIFAASTWGGGTAVNWSASWQLPAKVRADLVREGMDFADGREFQDCMDSVCERVGVTTENTKHNTTNSLVKDAARRLGMGCVTVARNTGIHPHNCGICGLGCPSGEKQSSIVTWLTDAQKAGARCIQKCEVKELIFSGNQVSGVHCMVEGSLSLTIHAKKVVVCAGTLHSPNILARSGVRNPHLGKNLRLQPTVTCAAFFSNKRIDATSGPIITTCVTEVENLDGGLYGAKIMPSIAVPGFAYYTLPWRSPVAWRQSALRFNQTAIIAAVARDKDSVGSVSADSSSRPVVTYQLGQFDMQSLMEGMVTMCKVLLEAGAVELQPLNPDCFPAFRVVPGSSEAANKASWKEYEAALRKTGIGKRYVSAHPLGTCKMGSSPATSVVDLNGQVWGYEGLYVADGSLYPLAIGVNPMIPTMAIAEWVSRQVIAETKKAL